MLVHYNEYFYTCLTFILENKKGASFDTPKTNLKMVF